MKRMVAMAALAAFAAVSSADVYFYYRTNEYYVNGSDASYFSDSYLDGYIYVYGYADSDGDSRRATWTFGTANYVDWYGDSNLDVQNIDNPGDAGPGSVSADIVALTTDVGALTTVFQVPDTNTIATFSRSVIGGQMGLNYRTGGSGGTDDHGGYTFNVHFLGDWSGNGTAPGQHEVYGINSNWTVDTDFSFDGTYTNFAAHMDDYVYGDDLGLNMRLWGAAVPEPASIAALALGAIAMIRRRRK